MPEGFRTCRLIPAPEGFQSWENPFMGVTLYDDKPKLCGRASNRCGDSIHYTHVCVLWVWCFLRDSDFWATPIFWVFPKCVIFWGFLKPLPKCHFFRTSFFWVFPKCVIFRGFWNPLSEMSLFGPLFRSVFLTPPPSKKGTPSIYTLLHTPVHFYIPQKGGRLYTEIYPLFLEKIPLFWGVLERSFLQKMTLFGVSQKYPLRGGVPPP